VRNVIVAGLTLLLFGVGIASAQTAVTPATSSLPATEPGRFSISAEGAKTFLRGEDLDTGANPGFRLTAGYAFTDRWGVGAASSTSPRATPARASAPPARCDGKIVGAQ
jgi:hypothetical protein